MSFLPLVIVWIVLALVVLALFLWRQGIARNEDDSLHVMHGTLTTAQTSLAQKLDVIDKWGKILTVTTVRILAHLSMTSSFWARDVCAVVSVPCMTCKLSSSFLAIPCRQRNRASTTSARTIQTITNGRKLINDLQIRGSQANLPVRPNGRAGHYNTE